MTLREMVPWRRSSGSPTVRTETSMPITALQRDMNRMFDRLFEEAWGGGFVAPTFARTADDFDRFRPSVEVRESDSELEVTAELPGLTDKEIDVALAADNQTLTIRGEKKLEASKKEQSFYQCERSYGAFRRTLTLPTPVDPEQVKASYKNGVLALSMRKADEKSQGVRHIDVRAV